MVLLVLWKGLSVCDYFNLKSFWAMHFLISDKSNRLSLDAMFVDESIDGPFCFGTVSYLALAAVLFGA